MRGLLRLSMLSVVRQPAAVTAFLVIPAILVLVTADAFEKFSNVLGVGTGSNGHHHSLDHFDLISGMWAAGMSAAIIAAMSVTEAHRADGILALRSGVWRWSLARCASLCVIGLLATALSLMFVALRGAQMSPMVWVGTAICTTTYVFMGQVIAYFAADTITAIGIISGLWIVDALLSPTMADSHWWQAVASPFYSAEQLAMGVPMTPLQWTMLIMWPAAVALAFLAFCRYRPTISFPTLAVPVPFGATGKLFGRSRKISGTALVLVDLLRHRGLLLFTVFGPLSLMLGSLWLFGNIEVAVPAMHDGQRVILPVSMPELHAAYMGMIAVVSFSGTVGYLIAADLHEADRKLALNSVNGTRVVGLRLLSLLAVSPVATLFSLILVALVQVPTNWGWFIAAHIMAGWTFTFFGYCVGLLTDPVAGILTMMFYPFIDVGIAQNYMLGPVLPSWAPYLPSHPFVQVCIGAAFGDSLFDNGNVLWACGILLVALICVVFTLRASLPMPGRRTRSDIGRLSPSL